MFDEFDLLLLDRQVPGVAAFFAKTFLSTVPARDAAAWTNLVYQKFNDMTTQLMRDPPSGVPPLTIDEVVNLQMHRDAALQGTELSVSGLVASLPLKKKAKEFAGEQLGALGQDTIPIDEPTAEKLLKKRKLKGDYGVRFEVETEYYEQVVRKVEKRPPDHGKPVTRLTIDVTDLQWLK